MKSKAAYRILVCDDVVMVRLAVQQAFKNAPEFLVLHEAAGARDSIAKAAELKPDLVIMDVQMPDMDGAEATHQILLRFPEAKVLAYSADPAWETIDRMLAAGACGYVLKGADVEEVVRAARTVLAGGHYLSLALLRPAECND